MNNNYQISGKSYTISKFANVKDTIKAVKRIVKTHYLQVADLAKNLQSETDAQTFENIWNYVRENIQYKNDEPGKEQLRRPQRTLHDGIGDCDDMSILISSILMNLGYRHQLLVTAYKDKNTWQHIYPVAYTSNSERYVIDCVPEIPYFNYEAKGIKNKIIIDMPSQMDFLKDNNMRLEELGEVDNTAIEELTQEFNLNGFEQNDTEDEEFLNIQGLLGNVAIVDEEEEYDTILSGTELQRNLILRQLIDAKNTLTSELTNPTELSQYSDVKKDLYHINDIIKSYDDEDDLQNAIQDAINSNTLYKNFYKTIEYAFNSEVNGLEGSDDDMFYLKLMDQEGILDKILNDDLEGLGRLKFLSKLKNKIKTGIQKFKKKHPAIAKIGYNIKKFSPATFAARKSIEVFYRANAFQIASKTALGYASESQAKKLGYSKSELQKFIAGKNKAESTWYSLGGNKAYFKKMIMSSKGAKQLGLKGFNEVGEIGGFDTIGELAIAPAIISAVTKVFGSIISYFKKLKLKKKNQAKIDASKVAVQTKSATKYTSADQPDNTENMNTDDKSGVTEETVTDENGKETTIYKDEEGNEISKYKAFFLKHKKMIIIISIVLVVGIIAIVIWKIRQRALSGLGSAGLSSKQQNYIRRKGLNNRAYASLIREEIGKDGKSNNKTNRRKYYKQVFQEAFSRPISQKQTTAALNHNDRLKEVRTLAKSYGGGSDGWRKAWADIKKKR
jgi:hypothetical protein